MPSCSEYTIFPTQSLVWSRQCKILGPGVLVPHSSLFEMRVPTIQVPLTIV